MKKLTTVLLSLLLLLALSACTNKKSQITRDDAIEIALSKAGISKDVAFDLDAEMDREQNGTLWEVDFESGQFEYSFDIDATTGTIVTSQKEIRD